MLSFVVSEALVDLRRAGRVGVSAILLITLSLTALGGFWLMSLNLGRAVGQWRDRVRDVSHRIIREAEQLHRFGVPWVFVNGFPQVPGRPLIVVFLIIKLAKPCRQSLERSRRSALAHR